MTAIRSSATILSETRDIDPEWRDRFHRNMAEDSARLAESAEALVGYLDEGNSTEVTGSTPQEELVGWLQARDFHISELEGESPGNPDSLVAAASELRSAASRELALRHLNQYREDALRLPLDAFQLAARECGFDPAHLANGFGTDLIAVFRRLATLKPESAGSEIGLVACDGSGTLTFRKPVTGFPLPRYSAACALWPLYQALPRPMSPVRQVVELGGRAPATFLTYAICQPDAQQGFNLPQTLQAAMLILPAEGIGGLDANNAQPIGTSCRICPQSECVARREPSIMAGVF